jgi:thioredoxin reductase (NADPH)
MAPEKIAVIGAGPAGMAAAIQLSRYGIRPVVFEKDKPGGLLPNARFVENYPGFPDGISGTELSYLFRKQFGKSIHELKTETVLQVDLDGKEFLIRTETETYRFDKVIIASGTVPKKPECHIDTDALACICYDISRILDLSGKTVAIAGSGDAAFDYALSLCTKNEILILNRGDKRKCLDILFEEAVGSPNITYIENTNISGIVKTQDGIRLQCVSGGSNIEMDSDLMIFATGRDPCTEFISSEIAGRINELTGSGLLFFAGDVRNGILRQTAISAGDGVAAAMRICKGPGGDAD